MQHGPNENNYSGYVCFNWDEVGQTWSYTNHVNIQVTDGPFFPNWGDIKIDPGNNEYYYSLDSYNVEFRVNLGVFTSGPQEVTIEYDAAKITGELKTCHLGTGITIQLIGRDNEGTEFEIAQEEMVEDMMLVFTIQTPFVITYVGNDYSESNPWIQTVTTNYIQDGETIKTELLHGEHQGPAEGEFPSISQASQEDDPLCLSYKEIFRAKGYLANPEQAQSNFTWTIEHSDGTDEMNFLMVPVGKAADYQIEFEEDFDAEISIYDNPSRSIQVTKVTVDLEYELDTYYNVVDNGGWEAETPDAQEDALAGIYVAEILAEIEANDRARHHEISGLLREIINKSGGDIRILERVVESIDSGNATAQGMQELLQLIAGEDEDSPQAKQIELLTEIASNTSELVDDTELIEPTVNEAVIEEHTDESDTLISKSGEIKLTVETIMTDLHPSNWDIPVITGRTMTYDIDFPVLGTSIFIDFNTFSVWIDLFREIMRWIWTLIFAYASIRAVRSAFV